MHRARVPYFHRDDYFVTGLDTGFVAGNDINRVRQQRVVRLDVGELSLLAKRADDAAVAPFKNLDHPRFEPLLGVPLTTVDVRMLDQSGKELVAGYAEVELPLT